MVAVSIRALSGSLRILEILAIRKGGGLALGPASEAAVGRLHEATPCLPGKGQRRQATLVTHEISRFPYKERMRTPGSSTGPARKGASVRAREGSVFREFLSLRHGIPSHDTFSRVFRLLDPVKFHACFLIFMRKFSETIQGVIAIDGKTLRRSFDRASKKSALHLVSAKARTRVFS